MDRVALRRHIRAQVRVASKGGAQRGQKGCMAFGGRTSVKLRPSALIATLSQVPLNFCDDVDFKQDSRWDEKALYPAPDETPRPRR